MSEKILVVEDSAFLLETWRMKIGDDLALCYELPKQVFEAEAKGDFSWSEIRACVIDYYFDDQPETNGLDFAEMLRRKNYQGAIWLCSDATFDDLSRHESLGIQLLSKDGEGWDAVLKS